MTEPNAGTCVPNRRRTRPAPSITIADKTLQDAFDAAQIFQDFPDYFGASTISDIPQYKRQYFLDWCAAAKARSVLWENLEAKAGADYSITLERPFDCSDIHDRNPDTWPAIAQRCNAGAKMTLEELEKYRADWERAQAEAAGQPYLVRASDMQFASPKLAWAIDGLIPEQGYCMIYGDPGAYKTFLALDIALSIAAGHDTWHGRAINSSGSPVLYVASEGYSGLQGRIDAWVSDRNDGEPLDDFFTLDKIPVVGTRNFDKLIRQMQTQSEYYDLVVLDTVRGALGSELNERNPAAAPALKAEVDKLRYTFQCPVLLVHHKTKYGDAEAGTSAFRGDADVMLEIRSRKDIELFASKFRDAPKWTKPLRFKTRKVEGHDNIVLDCKIAETPAPKDTSGDDIDRALMQLEPREYTLTEAARLIAPAVPYKSSTLRIKKLPTSKFYNPDSKTIVIPEVPDGDKDE